MKYSFLEEHAKSIEGDINLWIFEVLQQFISDTMMLKVYYVTCA